MRSAFHRVSLSVRASAGRWLGEPWRLYGHVAQGFTANPDSPADRQNFGRLFDDRANDYRLNQVLLTLERPLTFEPGEFGWGAKSQLMYGSDARFIHHLGVMDNMDDHSVQLDLVELFGQVHLPLLTEGGVDLKAGTFVTLMGAEVIDATGNPLYSHSYSFNFGIPFMSSTGRMPARTPARSSARSPRCTGPSGCGRSPT